MTKLYFSPLACSLASRITLYEAGIDAEYVEVDPKTKRLPDGGDYRRIHPLGLVPALETDDGALVTENAAILAWLGEAWLGRPDPAGARALAEWLSFLSSEVHKGIFAPHFDPQAPEAAREYARARGASRLRHLDAHLKDRQWLLDALSVADVYLYAMLNWTQATPIDLADYPALTAFYRRMSARPHVKRAFEEELPLYRAEQARAQA